MGRIGEIRVRSTVIMGVADQGVRMKTARTRCRYGGDCRRRRRRSSSRTCRVRVAQSGERLVGEDRRRPPSNVRVRGTKEAIAKIRDSSIVAYVDLDGIAEGDYGLPVRLERADNVGVDQLDPTIVSIHVE